jgi:hypothetical protein
LSFENKIADGVKKLLTSSAEQWRRFLAILAASIGIGLLGLLLFVAVIDPYDNLAFSPNWKRHRVTGNERYAFPGMIRHGHFDSAIFGTSTMMLLDPKLLDLKLDGRFGNFAMASATAWEQTEIIKFFSSHVRSPRTILIGIDVAWCSPTAPAAKLSSRPFPPWAYDDNPWNDYLHLIHIRSLIYSVRQLLTMVGRLRSEYRDDGYFQFVPDDNLYDPVRARAQIYLGLDDKAVATFPDAGNRPPDWTFPDLAMLSDTIDYLPAETRKVIIFVPYHGTNFVSPDAWRQYSYCKNTVVDLVHAKKNTMVIDFMRPNRLTQDDSAYWDRLHYRIGPAAEIVEALASAIVDGQNKGPLFEVLWRQTE